LNFVCQRTSGRSAQLPAHSPPATGVLAFAAMAAKRAFVQQRRGDDDDDDERASERACTAPKRARTGMATEKSAPD